MERKLAAIEQKEKFYRTELPPSRCQSLTQDVCEANPGCAWREGATRAYCTSLQTAASPWRGREQAVKHFREYLANLDEEKRKEAIAKIRGERRFANPKNKTGRSVHVRNPSEEFVKEITTGLGERKGFVPREVSRINREVALRENEYDDEDSYSHFSHSGRFGSPHSSRWSSPRWSGHSWSGHRWSSPRWSGHGWSSPRSSGHHHFSRWF